ncbi:MAG: hypothetical protein E8D44_08685 [Nitrospira sp.]|jgi:hypothetical protein|nr:MAG: hypothetical protein E8D44_08685 [Nitrospira sp.]
MDFKEQLEDIVSRSLQIDIIEAEEAIALNMSIGSNADAINNATFGAYFGSMQRILSRYAILSVTKLFERASKQYPTRSIPAALKVLSLAKNSLPISQRLIVLEKLAEFGYRKTDLESYVDSQITELIAKEFESRLPQVELPDPMSRSLDALRTVRDKSIAHHESIDTSIFPKATYGEMQELLSYAKDFVSVIGFGYLNIVYRINGDYFLTSDAETSSRCLKRLLRKAEITEATS